MPVHAYQRLTDAQGTETGWHFVLGDGREFTLLYADIPGNSWNANRLAKLVERAQQLIDKRVPLTDLPADDPDRLADPGLPHLFWDGADLVARQCIIENATWDGTRLSFRLRRPS